MHEIAIKKNPAHLALNNNHSLHFDLMVFSEPNRGFKYSHFMHGENKLHH
jgi:hypothetical protein